METKTKKKWNRQRCLSILLSLVMVSGMFGGIIPSMTASAADLPVYKPSTLPVAGVFFKVMVDYTGIYDLTTLFLLDEVNKDDIVLCIGYASATKDGALEFPVVSVNGRLGFMNPDNLQYISGSFAMGRTTVVGGILNVRSGPGADNSKIGSLSEGTVATILGETDGWLKIVYGSVSGWIMKEHTTAAAYDGIILKDYDITVTVTCDSLNVRAGPGTVNNIIGSLRKGQSAKLISESSGWLKIVYGSGIGWISKQYTTNSWGGNNTTIPYCFSLWFDAGAGTLATKSMKVYTRVNHSGLPTPTPPDGYVFAYWQADNGMIVRDGNIIDFVSELHAVYVEPKMGNFSLIKAAPLFDDDTGSSSSDTIPEDDEIVIDAVSADGNFGHTTYNGKTGWVRFSDLVSSDSPTATVKFNAGGGEFASGETIISRKVTKGSSIGEFPEVTRDGYTFDYWRKFPSGTEPLTGDEKVTGPMRVMAEWTENPTDPSIDETEITKDAYDITFDPQGGSASLTEAMTINGTFAITGLPTATRSNYTFNGWFTAATGGTKVDKSTVFTKNSTVFAQWTYTGGGGFTGGGAADAPTTNIDDMDVDFTIDKNDIVTIKPTAEQLDELLEGIDENGVLNIDVSDIGNIKGAMLALDLKQLTANENLKVLVFNVNGHIIRVPIEMLLGLGDNTSTVYICITIGSIVFELTDANGKAIDWYDYENPVTISLPFTPPQDISTHQIVMIDKSDDTIIPRSWYADGSVYAKVCAPGTYDAKIVPLASFTDTHGKWMAEAVGYMGARGIVEGVGGDLFDAQGVITRAHFVTMLMRALNVTDVPSTRDVPVSDYEDVPEWAKPHVITAAALGITLTDEDGSFNPDAPILRQEMFFMAYEAMKACGMLPSAYTQNIIPFTDWDDVESEHADAIQNLAKLKLVNGNGNGTLNPNGESTRSEGAQFLYNILKYDAK